MMFADDSEPQRMRTPGLEFFAVRHCNLRCCGCAQNSPLLERGFADVNLFSENLKVLKKYLAPQKITILGGEPLLHPQIAHIVEIAKESQMFERVCVTTNGIRALHMPDTFWRSIDRLRITVYPSTKLEIESCWNNLSETATTFGVELQKREMNEFGRVICRSGHFEQSRVRSVFDGCVYKDYCHTLYEGRVYRCSPAVHMADTLLHLGVVADVSDAEAIVVSDRPTLFRELKELLYRTTPLAACNWCYGSNGDSFKHRQLSAQEVKNPVIAVGGTEEVLVKH
jgi:GTP 3',8-cyclase